MFHVWVDPLFGDDVTAVAYNPTNQNPSTGPNGNPRPLSTHWDNGSRTPKAIQGYLQNAPYPFQTIRSAITYVSANFAGLRTGNPWTNPDNGKQVTHVVIHCLPGLYGPTGAGLPTVDPANGLPYNGEVFPILLSDDALGIDSISLQGTSALDTILDARGQSRLVGVAGTFGPYAACSGTTVVTGPWGFNDLPTGCPDRLPVPAGGEGRGFRYNCEHQVAGTSASNLQTFLSVPSVPAAPPEQASQRSPSPTTEDFRRAVRDALRNR